ncbi:MAG: hypothetical protein ABIN25_05715 [Ginsengibacter sp.]
MSQSRIQGEYMFNMQEMVAGFKFTADGKFEFFHSYGAIDRTASGTFTVEGKTILLKSDKAAGKDFNVIEQSKLGIGYSLQFKDAETYFINEIRCTFFIGGERHDEYTDQKGLLTVPYPHCDSILVFHPLFPDFVTCIKDDKNENNHFVLTLNPSLAQVSFKGIDFTIEDEITISCMHNYLIPVEGIRFKKQ